MTDSSQTLLQIVSSLPSEIAVFDSEKRLSFANDAFARLTGTASETLHAKSLHEVLSALAPALLSADGAPLQGDADQSAHQLLGAVERGSDSQTEVQLAAGEWRLMRWHTAPQGGHMLLFSDVTGLRESVETSRHASAMVGQILEACPLPLAMIRLSDLKILYESPANNAMFAETPVNKATHAGVYDEDPAERETYLRRLRRDGAVQNFPIHFRRRSGERFVAALSARLIELDGEQVIVSCAFDLTDTQRRESELRQAREMLEDAIESLSEGFALYDAQDRLVMCNSQYRLFNQGSEDLLVPGAYWPDVTRQRAERGHFKDAEGRIENWVAQQIRERENARNEEFRWIGDRWFEYSHRLTRQGGFVSTWRDITERKAMEQSLRDSEAMVRQVLEACPVPVSVTRAANGLILYENPASRSLLRSGQAFSGETVLDRWMDTDQRRDYLDRLRNSGSVDGMEVRYRKADGTDFPCEISARLVIYRDEELIVSSLADLTATRAAEAELDRQREMLHQNEKLSALGEVLAGVAHELNNPLSVLLGQAVLLKDAASDPAIVRRAERIGEAANRCARIVKTFLSMARHQPIAFAEVDIGAVIDHALEVTRYALRVAGIDVHRLGSRDLPPVMGDAHQLQQVVTNLLVNAQHALEDIAPPRRLEILTTARHATREVEVRITDNGTGIPESIRGRIFEPLFTTKDVDRGTGVGLAVCHRLVEAHKGTIRIEGQDDSGAIFVVRLPVADPAPIRQDASAITRVAGPAYRVLIVDDEPAVAEFLAEALEAEGHFAQTAINGREAIGLLEDGQFDAVLSDVRMPEMDGPTIYKLLLQRWPLMASRVGFITGDTLSPRVREFMQECKRPYLEKPIMPEELYRFLDRVVGAE